MTEDTSTIRRSTHEKYVHMLVELESINAEDRLTRDGRCVLGCKGQYVGDDTGGNFEFQHAEFCPFSLAEQISAENN